MPNWKKVIVSGSDASLNSLSASLSIISPSFTGSLEGTSSWAQNTLTASFVTSSNVFGPFGSNSVLSASYSLTASYSANAGNITGGTINYVPLWTSTSTLGLSSMFQSASNIGINTLNPYQKLTVLGNAEIGTLSTSGGPFLYRAYVGSSNNYINVFGSENSSGNLTLGYGAVGKAGSAGYTSTLDIITVHRGLLSIGQGTLQFLQTRQAVNTIVGGDLPMTSSFLIDNTGLASFSDGVNISGSLNVSRSITASNALINGTLTVQTIVAQVITSSTDFVTGSTRFGTQLIDTHEFTGSVSITGSLNIIGPATINNLTGSLFGTASWAQNAVTASFIVSSSFATSASLAQTASFITASNIFGPHGASSVLSSSFAISSSFTVNSLSASLAQTASFVTASNVRGPHGFNSVLSSSYAISASFVTSASFATTAENVLGGNTNRIALWDTTTTLSSSLLVQSPGIVTAYGLIASYTQQAGAGTNLLYLQNRDTTATVTHQTRLGTQQLGGGIARTLLYAAAPDTGDTLGELAIVSENGGATIATIGKYTTNVNNTFSLYTTASVETNRINSAGNSFFNGGNIGINITSPTYRFQVAPSSVYSALNTGDVFVIYNPTLSNANLVLGVNGAGTSQGALIQGRDGTSTAFAIQLQPYGGNVGIGVLPGVKLDINIGVAKTDTTLYGYGSMMLRSNESSNYSNLGINFIGGATQANRGFQFQTGELGVSNSGNIVLQPYGGNVGVGTTLPASKLEVSGSNGALLRLRASGIGNNYIVYNSGSTELGYIGYGSAINNGLTIMNYRNDLLNLGTNNTIVMIVTGSNVGISINPSHKLDVNGNIGISGKIILGASSVNHVIYDQSANGFLIIGDSSTGITTYNQTIHNFRDRTGDTTYATINSTGLGLGISPSYKLDVSGSVRMSGSVIITGLNQTPQTNVVTINTSTGQLYYTASSAIGGGGLSGGTTNFVPLWTSATTLGSSVISQSSGNIGISTTPSYKLDIGGSLGIRNKLFAAVVGDYNAIYSSAGNLSLYLGGTTDPANYYYNTTHRFRSIAGTTNVIIKTGGAFDGKLGINVDPSQVFEASAAIAYAKFTSTTGTNQAVFQFVNSGGDFFLGMDNSTGTNFGGTIGYAGVVYHSGAYPIQFFTSATLRMTLTSGGNLGIGTASPSYKLDVSGSARTFSAQSGGGINIIDLQNTDNTAGVTHLARFGVQQQGGGVGRTLLYAASPDSSNTAGDLTILTENGGSIIATIGKSGTNNTISLYNSGSTVTERIRLHSVGNSFFTGGDVAIGISVPTARLHVSGTTGAIFEVDGAGTAGANALYVNSSGNVGIATASPSYRLDVSGSARISGSLAVGNILPSATVGRIDAANDVVAFSTSDIRFKTNLTPINNAIEKITTISGYEFDWIPNQEYHGYEGRDVGVIAQEIEKVLPEVVTTRDSGYKAVKYEKIVPLLIQAIKEQQVQIDELRYLLQNKT